MSVVEFSPDHPEYVSEEELFMAEEHNVFLLEGYYQERMSSLRADVFGKLTKHDALRYNTISWAVFRTPAEEVPGSLAFESDKETLLLTAPIRSPLVHVPMHALTIRILTNERFTSLEGEDEFLSFDFTLDGQNDAQYHIDSTTASGISESLTPIFVVRDNGILSFTENFHLPFTPTWPIKEKDNESEDSPLFPLGYYLRLEDAVHALAIGQQLVDHIMDQEPTHISQHGVR